MKYKDPNQSIDARVEDLSRMTLEEKIGQMLQVERKHTSADLVNKYFIGSVMSEGGSMPAPQASAESWVDMVNEFQKGALSTRLRIPVFYGVDAVHGHNTLYNATIFPHNIGLGATRDPELVKRIGAATALEVRATGIQYAYAPCIAVCRDPRWGRCYESYSEDPELVQAMTEIIPGLQGDIPDNLPKGVPFISGKEKVIGSAKHYVGDGGTVDGINEHNTVIDRDGLMKIHMPPYLTSINKGVASIMVSYSSWNGVKMHAHHDLITSFLKNTLHFKGFVISDFKGIDRITTPHRANMTYSIEAGVSAGIDMFMYPKLYTEFIDGLSMLVKSERIPMSRIDDAEHRNLAREAVRKSMVLLKNGESVDKPLLPLPKKAPKILVAGIHADNLGYQCGGWTIQWQGVSGNNLLEGTTILNAVKNTVDPETTVIYKEKPDAEFVKSNEFSYGIVVVGEPPYAETHGDNMKLEIPDPAPEIIRNVCGTTKCVVIVISGRPLVIEPYVGMVDAVVAAWLPGSEGQGVADVIYGDYGFTGKLPRTWFKSVDQLPMNVGDPHYDPLFPFGQDGLGEHENLDRPNKLEDPEERDRLDDPEGTRRLDNLDESEDLDELDDRTVRASKTSWGGQTT
ncbi:beta-glucosidase [Vigna unguiculata]|uniref:Beta-glucosidase n=1 Tax=Vigna unguiculata TaxID=3917 RepID=A0A4D6M7K8_VIGUN|nr:beta-glucosidase [Vigna unguiculata]